MQRLAILVLSLFFLTAAQTQAAEQKFDAATTAKAIAPFLDATTLAVSHVDLTRLDVDAGADWFAKIAKLKPAEIAAPKKMAADTVQALIKAGARNVFVVVTLIAIQDEGPFVVIPLEKGADADKIKEAAKPLTDGALGAEVINNAVVIGSARRRAFVKKIKAEERPELAKAFAAAGDGVARVALIISPAMRDEVEKDVPKLPPALGGGSVKTLTRGAQWVALRIDAPPKFKAVVIVQAADKDSAKALHGVAAKGIKWMGEQKEWDSLAKLLPAFMPKLDGDQLTLTVDEPLVVGVILPAIQSVRQATARTISQNNMKQLGIAFHNLASLTTDGTLLSVANFDKQGKPLLSWRVHILQYLGPDEAKLYKDFHLDEPWDSEHNKKLIARMPKMFANPVHWSSEEPGKTTYLAPVHKDAMFTGDKTALRLPTDIPDGTSNTILLVDVEAEAGVIWTKPDDLKLDPKNPHKSLGTRDAPQFTVLFADGSVRALPKKIDKATLWALFTRNGGEKVNLP